MEEGFVWKTRDAAEELLNERRRCWSVVTPRNATSHSPPAERNGGGGSGGPGSGGRGRGRGGGAAAAATHNPSSRTPGSTDAIMPVRDEFDLTGLKQRLYHAKSGQIQQAFQHAATCVLKALTDSANSRSQSSGEGAAAAAAAVVPRSASSTSYDDPDLPATIRDWIRLEACRRETFDRTRNNKEYIKKKKPTTTAAAAAELVKADPDGATDADATIAPAAPPPPTSPSGSIHFLAPSSAASGGRSIEQIHASPSPAVVPAAVTSDGGSGAAGGSGGPYASAPNSSSAAAATTAAPKFTRNTPASSAAALDFRFNSSRAILCAAGNLVFDALTPPPLAVGAAAATSEETSSQQQQQPHLDPLSVPQNPALSKASAKKGGTTATAGTGVQVNMGAVVVEAQLLSQRTVSVVENAMRRAHLRHLYRVTNAECEGHKHLDGDFVQFTNPYLLKSRTNAMDPGSNAHGNDDDADNEDDDDDFEVEKLGVHHHSNPVARTDAWQARCLPRLLAILDRGAGHAIYHDYHWTSRHGRLADLLHKVPNRYGPHLIVTIDPDVDAFCREFENGHISRLIHRPSTTLRAVAYHGSAKQRKILRTRFFRAGKGLATSPWHVMVTSYGALLDDFLHFSQMPFDSVVLDDGILWMAAAHGDPNSGLGSIWENLFAKNDQQIGLAGTTLTDEYWNFALDGRELPESIVKDGWVGLTCRHRILTSSVMSIDLSRGGQDKVPVSGLLSFVVPHFADVVREEWDRSRIASDADSMAHFRALVARSTVAHFVGEHVGIDLDSRQQESQAMLALNGKLESKERSDPVVPEYVYDDAFVSDGKINFSRRSCLAWLGRHEKSWLRYELGKAMLQHILDAMKVSNRHGHICEEITTASSTTSSGATGQVAGTMAYRLAIRCCRHFGSEQGLRQHVSALHAPPGTWLCRTCGSDCISNQARTHHERSCGVPGQGSIYSEPSSTVGAIPTVGQGSSNKGGVAKKKPGRASSAVLASNADEKKDPDGSFRVPGYRGVWVDQFGKHFVKIAGARLKKDGGDELLLFDSIDDAARKHDEILKKEKKGKLELNFKPDGSRIVYEDIAPSSTSGIGGSATTVVPALSIINIKVRPSGSDFPLRIHEPFASHNAHPQDLPPDVKPLLRDPRQTSRTGGNSKRHVYAYRGVCRQARKGHDRWQSQISFMGVNHYVSEALSCWVESYDMLIADPLDNPTNHVSLEPSIRNGMRPRSTVRTLCIE
jgi:hypothetical protein